MKRYLLSASALLLPLVPAPVAFAAERGAEVEQENATRTLYLTLIRQARTDGRARAALAYLDDFDRKYPADRDARVLRVNCLLDLNQIDAARAALDRIAANDRSGAALAVRGHVLAAQGQWPQASEQYAAALQATPADAFIANALGYARLQSGRTAEALETLRAARDLAPDDAVIRNNLMLALTLSGRLAEADALLSGVTDNKAKAQLRLQVAGEAARIAAAGGGTPMLGS